MLARRRSDNEEIEQKMWQNQNKYAVKTQENNRILTHTNFKNNTNISRQTRSVGKEEVRQCGNVAGLWKEKNQQEYADKNNIW